jgi:hypothetical protein
LVDSELKDSSLKLTSISQSKTNKSIVVNDLRSVNFYTKQTNIMLFWEITNDQIKLLPADFQTKIYKSKNPCLVERVLRLKKVP